MKRYLILASLVLLTGCGKQEVVTTEDISTEVITTELKTEAPTTERKTEAPTTEKKTRGETTEVELKITNKTSEENYISIEAEESTGEVDIDGYGWVQLQYDKPYHIMENHLTRSNGSIHVFGHHETWYSTNEPCGQATAVDIPGKHAAEDGTIRDKDGYICVASSDHDFYTIVMTSVGPGKVYDCGCSHGTIDVYTTW